MPVIPPPTGTPYFRHGSDHLGHFDCDPCRVFPDGHPEIERRLAARAKFLGHATIAEMASVRGNCGGSFHRPPTAEEVCAGRTPDEVAQAYGYQDAEEMRRCEKAGREVDAEMDARSRAVGLAGGHQLDLEARLAVLAAAERLAVVDPVCGDRSHDHSSSSCLGPRPVDEVHSEEELAGVRAAVAHDQAQMRAAAASVNVGRVLRGVQMFTAPLNGGPFVDVGSFSSDGVTTTYPDEVLPQQHEPVEFKQWRVKLSGPFSGMARCACGHREFRNPVGGGPEAARAAVEAHAEAERVAWAENKLTGSLRQRLRETSKAWSRVQADLDEARGDIERRAAEALRAAELRSGLRDQLGTLGRLMSERTGERDAMRAEAARLRSAVSEAWTLLGSLPGRDADLIHEHVVRIRERLKAAAATPAEQAEERS